MKISFFFQSVFSGIIINVHFILQHTTLAEQNRKCSDLAKEQPRTLCYYSITKTLSKQGSNCWLCEL